MASRTRAEHGFTLVEVMVVVAIVAVLAAIAVPLFLRDRPEQRLKDAAADLAANIRQARSLAVAGTTAAGVAAPDAVEVRFDDANDIYEIVAMDTAAGGEGLVKAVRMADYDGAQIDLVPSVTAVRFRRNGAANRIATVTLTETMIARTRNIEVTRAGLARIQ